MTESTTSPLNIAKIAVGGGIAGAIFAVGSMLIFLIGIPLIRYIFPGMIILGCAVALLLHFIRRETPGVFWIGPSTRKSP